MAPPDPMQIHTHGSRMTLPCRACGQTRLVDLGPCASYPPASTPTLQAMVPGRLFRCRDCGFGQRVPCPDDALLAAAYRESPVTSLDYSFNKNAAWNLARDLLLSDVSSAKQTILDIGCHTGLFLAGLPPRWRRYGIEIGDGPRRLAFEQHGVEIIADRIESVSADWNGRFDVVTLFDVFEHLVFPLECLRRASDLVRSGGRLIISTSDMDAWTWRVTSGQHWYLQTPLHLSFGSRYFFRQINHWLPLNLESLRRIPHQQGTTAIRRRQAVELIYWQCQQRGSWWRLMHRLIQTLPGYRDLRHRQSPPWASSLNDHVLVAYNRA